ncbi:Smr/MutS family protein [Nereida sp. MMG025]|uniref:Smr/MutS family protein n=1 Tax=Nereida sp. MMG025 TaxID=2909981 RepID=UPI001F252099|nr:Smr/MutS family protein [Nereida sp. MMG025]MCF6444632.1 Smr/MutS family protein [Nereida sp. MMG025]
MSKRRKQLSDQEKELWARVAQTAIPMRNAPVEAPHIISQKPKERATQHPAISKFQVGSHAPQRPKPHDLKPDVRADVANAPLMMDRKSFQTMKRGKLSPEGRIDLHGMTLAQAHPALTSFVMNAFADGKRLVLIITGKGKMRDEGGPMPARFGVLRHQVPEWLRMAPLAQCVLQVTEAHLKHGGSGAYYVYLKRRR